MRFNFSKSMLIIATLSALLSLSGNANDSIKNLVRDLKEHKRHIFAVGAVSSNLVLFVSGSSDKTDFNKGYQVKNENGEPADGKFGKLENAVALSKYTGVNSDDLMFVVSDSENSFLVTMNSQSVKLLDLSSSSIKSTDIKNSASIENCYLKHSLHLSSSTPGTFFILESSGTFYKLTFNDRRGILSSNGCNMIYTKHMCLSNGSSLVTISSSSCTGSPPPSSTFTAGFIGLHTVYIFSKSNEVYLFESGAIASGRTVALTKMSSDAAWVDSSTPDSNSSTLSASTQNSTLNLTIATIIMLVISLVLLIAIVYFARCHCSRDLIQFERLVFYKRASEESNPNQQQATSTTVRKRRPSPNAYVTEKMMERRREKAKRAKEKAAAAAETAASASASYSAQKQKKKSRSKSKNKSKNTSDGSRSPKNSSRGGSGTKSGTKQSRAGRRSTSKKRSGTR